MNRKKYLALLAKRKALLGEVDAILNLVETSTDKKETAQQTEQRKAKLAECDRLDIEIEEAKDLLDRREEQTRLEERASGDDDEGAEADDDEDDDPDDDDEGEDERAHEGETRSERRERLERKATKVKTLAKRRRQAPRTLGGNGLGGLSRQEMRDLQGYSFIRAFNRCLEGRGLDGIEGEMHQQVEKEYRGAQIERNGGNLIIPQLVMRSAGCIGGMEQRDLTATGTTSATGDQGGLTIATQLGSLIDRLRKKLIMQQMGVTMLGGLQGNIDFPKVIADDQAVEKAENATSAESSPTFGKISLSPRRLPVFAEVSRQLLLQGSVDVEAWLRNDLAFQISQVMDLRAINGSGSGQPYGILNTVGVGAVALGTNGSAPTWDWLVDLETTVAALDADVGALGYVINTKTRGKLKKTLIGSNTAAEMIWDKRTPGAPLNEYKVGITNQMPSNFTKSAGSSLSGAIFGNFNDALMGQWGGLEFLVNPFSKDTEGLIRLNCWTFYDFIVRRVESFAVTKDIVTT